MLVLSRKADEHVSGTMTAKAIRELAEQLKDKPDETLVPVFDVMVVRVGSNGVKLGFECPRAVNVARAELQPTTATTAAPAVQ